MRKQADTEKMHQEKLGFLDLLSRKRRPIKCTEKLTINGDNRTVAATGNNNAANAKPNDLAARGRSTAEVSSAAGQQDQT